MLIIGLFFSFPLNKVFAVSCSPYYGEYRCTGSASCNNGGNGSCQTAICGQPEAYAVCGSGSYPLNEGGCYIECGSGGGGASCDSGNSVPVWVRVYSTEPGVGTVAWKPSTDAILGNRWSYNAPNGSGNFTQYRPAYEAFFTSPNWTWTWDTNVNRQSAGMRINLTTTDSGGNPVVYSSKNWSNHFCSGGIAKQLEANHIVTRTFNDNCDPNEWTCQYNRISCSSDTSYRSWCEGDYDGCWDDVFKLGVVANSGQSFGTRMGYYLDRIIEAYSTSNPAGAVDFHGRWSMSYMAKDDCASLTTKFNLVPPTGYTCNNVKLYQMSGVYGASPQDKTADLKVTSLANGSCDIEFNPASGGNMVTIEVKGSTPSAAAPTGKIFDPAISKTKACLSEILYTNFQAKAAPGFNVVNSGIVNNPPSSPVTVRTAIQVRDVSWVGGGLWIDPFVSIGGIVQNTRNWWDWPILNWNSKVNGSGMSVFNPGRYYYFALNVIDSQLPNPRICSGNPMPGVTYPSGIWNYCGNQAYNSNPASDPSPDRPWRIIKVVNPATINVGTVTATPQIGQTVINWNFTIPNDVQIADDIIGFNVYRDAVKLTFVDLINNTVNNVTPGLKNYSFTDTTALCNGVNKTYTVEVVYGYKFVSTPISCSALSKNAVATSCTNNSLPSGSLTKTSAGNVYANTSPTFNFTISTRNPSTGIYEKDLSYVPNTNTLTSSSGAITYISPLSTFPTIAYLNSLNSVYSGNFTIANIVSNTNLTLTLKDNFSGSPSVVYPLAVNIVPSRLLNVTHYQSNTTSSNPSSYCNTGSLTNAARFNISGPTIINNAQTALANAPLTIGAYTINSISNIAANYEVKCIRVSTIDLNGSPTVTNDYTAISAPFNVANNNNITITIYTGPVINSQSWIQANGGSAQFSSNAFTIPANLTLVPATYKNGANVFLFRDELNPPLAFNATTGSILYQTSANNSIQSSKIFVNPTNATNYTKFKSNQVDFIKNAVNTAIQAFGTQNVSNSGQLSGLINAGQNSIKVLTTNSIGGFSYNINLVTSNKFVPIIFRNGDLTITGNITASGSLNNTKFPIFFIDGNLTINPSVALNRLDGIFIVTGNITSTANSAPTADAQIVVNGSILAKGNISLQRNLLLTATQNNNPAYVLNFPSSVYFMQESDNIGVSNVYYNKYD